MLALDVVRIEAGLILLDVDYTSAAHALIPEQSYSPFEIGPGRLVDLAKTTPFVGKLALERERAAGGPARRLVGVHIEWAGIQAGFAARGLPPAISPVVDRSASPVFAPRGAQIGKLTSHGWSPILKEAIGLASVPAELRASRDAARRSSGRSRAAASGSARPSPSCRSWTCPASAPDDRGRPSRAALPQRARYCTTCTQATPARPALASHSHRTQDRCRNLHGSQGICAAGGNLVT